MIVRLIILPSPSPSLSLIRNRIRLSMARDWDVLDLGPTTMKSNRVCVISTAAFNFLLAAMSSDMDAQLNQMRQELEQERRLRKQADGRAEQADSRAEQADSRAKQAEKQTRRTTFEELLESCHCLSQSISVQTDKSLSTQGSTTSPKGKCCPTTLRPWLEFPSIQQNAFETVYNVLHPPNGTTPRFFSPLLYIEELGRAIIDRKIASEGDLRLYHNLAVENFITNIIFVLVGNPQCSQHLCLGQGVTFENYTNTLSDLAEDVQAYLRSLTPSNQPRRLPNPTYAD